MPFDESERERLESIIDGLLRHIKILENDLKYHIDQRDQDRREIEKLNKEIDRVNREHTQARKQLSKL